MAPGPHGTVRTGALHTAGPRKPTVSSCARPCKGTDQLRPASRPSTPETLVFLHAKPNAKASSVTWQPSPPRLGDDSRNLPHPLPAPVPPVPVIKGAGCGLYNSQSLLFSSLVQGSPPRPRNALWLGGLSFSRHLRTRATEGCMLGATQTTSCLASALTPSCQDHGTKEPSAQAHGRQDACGGKAANQGPRVGQGHRRPKHTPAQPQGLWGTRKGCLVPTAHG